MGVALLILLLASCLVTALALLATRLPSWRRRLGARSALPIVGGAQLLLGVVWVAWGWIDLARGPGNRSGGALAIVLGLLSCLQGVRRLLTARRPG